MLRGRVIAITRDSKSAQDFMQKITAEDGKPIALDTISLKPRNNDINRFLELLKTKNYDFSLFMSANAVEMIFAALDQDADSGKRIVSRLNDIEIVAVGPHTAEALEKHGINVSLVPRKYSTYGLIELLKEKDVDGKSIIIPRSSASTDDLSSALARMNMIVEELHVYDIVPSQDDSWSGFVKLLAAGKVDCIIFTSASSVRAFFTIASSYVKGDVLHDLLTGVQIIAIGPFTNDALKKENISAVMAEEHTVKGTIDTAVKLFGKLRKSNKNYHK